MGQDIHGGAVPGWAGAEGTPEAAPACLPPLVLVVEDDPDMADLIAAILEPHAQAVLPVETARDAKAFLLRHAPDIVVLDLILPDGDGMMVFCDFLLMRQQGTQHGEVIICSAVQSRRDPVMALKLGAADYVPKPFDVAEFETRALRVVNRVMASKIERLGPAGSARASEPSIPPAPRSGLHVNALPPFGLTPMEHRVLTALLSRPGELVTGGELLDLVWGVHDGALLRAVAVHVYRIRGKLALIEPAERPVEAIATVRGFGYRAIPRKR